jgi:hypothetical protein
MATRDYSKPEAQANQQSQQTAAAPPAMEPGQSQLTAIVTLVETQNRLLETQNRLLERQVQSPTVRGVDPFEGTQARTAATAFNDIVLDLKLKFPPTKPTLEFKALPANQIELTWTEATNNPDGYKVHRRQGSTGDFVEITVKSSSARTHVDGPLTSGTYFYKVLAFNFRGEAFSDIKDATIT